MEEKKPGHCPGFLCTLETPYSAAGSAGLRRLSGAMPSLLTNESGFGRLALLRLVGVLAAVFFLSPLASVFFFFTPTALPEALTFFGPP